MFVDAWFRDAKGNPVVGAEVDIWHSSPEGFYENQDPVQADMNLRGNSSPIPTALFGFRSVKPAGYPIPIDGPTAISCARKAAQYAAGHLHFLASKDGFKTLISQLMCRTTSFLETDVQFGSLPSDRRLCPARERTGAHARREGAVVFLAAQLSSWRPAPPSCRARRSAARARASAEDPALA